MRVIPIKTRVLLPPQDNVLTVVKEIDLSLSENSVVAVTAKAVAIHQGRCVLMKEGEEERAKQKDELIRQDAELYLERDMSVPFPRLFTIYEGTLCSASGIDASNSNGYWTLLPKYSSDFAHELRAMLCNEYKVKNLGVIVTDSRSYPMRNGTIGMTIGYAGFEPEFDYRKQTDLFGKPFHAERINVADCLASMATLAMGEGDESTPLAVIEDVSHIVFSEQEKQEDFMLALKVTMEQDVFTQFYAEKDWQKGGRHKDK